ncbi:MAG: EAL domain-containing protein [Hyphomicrobiaceae bacterium]|nr:EAL domain-containing protein [Hyphomicrobiaceae bacterium]
MTLITLAAGLGLYLQLGLSLWTAGLAALAIYVGLASAHAVVRRSEAIRELSYEVDRLENEVMRIARGTGPMPVLPPGPDQQPHFSSGPVSASPAARPPPASRPFPAGQPPASLSGAEPSSRPADAYRASPPPGQPQAAAPGPRPAQPGQAGHTPHESPSRPAGMAADPSAALLRPEPAPVGRTAVAAGPAGGAGTGPAAAAQPAAPRSADPQPVGQMARFWSFRPTDAVAEASRSGAAVPAAAMPEAGAAGPVPQAAPGPAGVRAETPRRESARAPAASDAMPAAQSAAPDKQPVESDVDVINGMIRKFSEEIGLAEAMSRAAAGSAPAPGAGPGSPARDEAVIAASVGALRAAAGEMRRPAESGPTAIERGILPPLRADAVSQPPPPVGPAHAPLAAMAEAIASQKLDVYVEPVLGLADRKARHYEVSLRLRSGPAGSVGPEDYIPLARSSGMLPLVDAARAARAAMVARHMDGRGSAGCLFSSTSAQSLTSERFLSELAGACRQAPRLPERVVFSIAQSELRGLSPAQWTTVRQLAGGGFRFAVEDVTSLDLDLAELRTAGFAFMLVAARVLLDGVSSLEGVLPAADLCRRLAGSGLTLIAVGLEGEEQLDAVLAAGVPLGRGPLFGPPRPVKAEALRQAGSAAA